MQKKHNKQFANSDETEPLKELPSCPLVLGKSATKHYRRIGKMAIEAGTLSARDIDVVAVAATAATLVEQAMASLEGGIITIGANGAEVAHPGINILAKAQATLLRALARLGLDPQSRDKASQATSGITEELFTID